MENKYFTPDIEDLCIGYELELLCVIEGNNEKEETWKNTIIYNLYVENKEEFIKSVRVPYLTKEQIEAEGWKHSEKNCFDFNDRWMCSWYPEHNRMEFYDDENENGFAGNCKDINTFRKLIKLLGI
jgi:hypothetical protein